MKATWVILLLGAANLHGEVELSGIMVADDGNRFLLNDTVLKTTSDWLKIGDAYDGFAIVAFDKASESLDVAAGGVTHHLTLRASKVEPQKAGLLTEKQLKRHKRLIEMYGSLGELFVAEVRSDSTSTYITPREVWKGDPDLLGRTIVVPNPGLFQGLVGQSSMEVILALRPGDQLAEGSPMIAAGTDGAHMAGDVALDEFRAYYTPAKGQPAGNP